MIHSDACCQPRCGSISKINWRRAGQATDPVKIHFLMITCACGENRPQRIMKPNRPRWRSGRAAIVAALITAAGAVIAAGVAGLFTLVR